MATPRRALTAVVTTAALLFSLAPTAGADDEADLRDEIADTKRAADRARDELEGLEEDLELTEIAAEDAATRVAYAEADLASISAKLNARQADLAAVEARLAEAQARLAETEDALAAALAVVADADAAATAADAAVSAEQEHLDRQAAVIYKHGRSTNVSRWIVAVRSAKSVSDLGHTQRLLKDASEEQRRVVDEMTALRQAALDARADAQAARVAAELRADEAEAVAADVAELVIAQEELVTSSERLVAAQQAAVRQLEVERAALESEAEQLAVAKDRTSSRLAELEDEQEELEAELKALLAKPKVTGPAPGMLLFPTAGRVGSPFGYRIHPVYGYPRLHAGVDISAPTGQVIVASAPGEVVRSGWCGGYGNCVVIDHGGGMATLYAHMSRRAVGLGTWVSMGQTIGYIGSTGLSTGPHLHYEVRINGSPTDPCAYLSEC